MGTFDLNNEHDRLALVERVFTYPAEPHRRKHGPSGYKDYESYRDWLRDDFAYRCVFSLLRETWPQTRFHIDHFIPQKERPDLICDYDNLILLESRANLIKGKRRLPNLKTVSLGKCLHVHTVGERMGEIEGLDGVGKKIIRVLRLNSEDATQIRRDWIGILRSVARNDEALFRKFIGYPKNLPNLAKANAPQNLRVSGLKRSANYLRETVGLPEWY